MYFIHHGVPCRIIGERTDHPYVQTLRRDRVFDPENPDSSLNLAWVVINDPVFAQSVVDFKIGKLRLYADLTLTEYLDKILGYNPVEKYALTVSSSATEFIRI